MAINMTIEAKQSIIAANNGLCAYCNQKLNEPYVLTAQNGQIHKVTDKLETETALAHYHAKSHGGAYTIGNMVATHNLCNRIQQTLPVGFALAFINFGASDTDIRRIIALSVQIYNAIKAGNIAERESKVLASCMAYVDSQYFKANKMTAARRAQIERHAQLNRIDA